MPVLRARLIDAAVKALAEAGIDTPEVDARALLRHCEGTLLPSSEIDDATATRFWDVITRRKSREPLQLIIGSVGFRYLDVKVSQGIFVPRPETEWVAEAAIELLRGGKISSPAKVLDLCAGTGVLGIAIAQEVPTCYVHALEISSVAVVLARENAIRNDVKNYLCAHGDATCVADIQAAFGEELYDLVVSNPPYVPAGQITQPEALKDPHEALYGGGSDGLRIPTKIISTATSLLRAGGWMVIEHDDSQGLAMLSCAFEHGAVEAYTGQDLTGRNRYLVARV